MPFAVWMISFLLVMALLVWAAVVAGIPQLYLAAGVLVLVVVAVAVAVRRRRRWPPQDGGGRSG